MCERACGACSCTIRIRTRPSRRFQARRTARRRNIRPRPRASICRGNSSDAGVNGDGFRGAIQLMPRGAVILRPYSRRLMRMNVHSQGAPMSLTSALHRAKARRTPSGASASCEAAERAFVRNGFHATTMQHVADEVGMSAGNLYRYFPPRKRSSRACASSIRPSWPRLSPSSWPTIVRSWRRCAAPCVSMCSPSRRRRRGCWSRSGPRPAAIRGWPRCSRAIDARSARAHGETHRRGESCGRGVSPAQLPFRRPVLPHFRRGPVQAHRDRRRFRSRS